MSRHVIIKEKPEKSQEISDFSYTDILNKINFSSENIVTRRQWEDTVNELKK